MNIEQMSKEQMNIEQGMMNDEVLEICPRFQGGMIIIFGENDNLGWLMSYLQKGKLLHHPALR